MREEAPCLFSRPYQVLIHLVARDPGTVSSAHRGTIGRMMRSIADAGIKVSFAYLATKDRVVTATSDNDNVRELMTQM